MHTWPARIPANRLGLYAAVAAVMGLLAVVLAPGSTSRAVVAVAVLILPVLLYLAFARPLIFPYGLYVLLIPFDNILTVGSHLTATRLLGIGSGVAILVWCLRHKQTMRLHAPSAALALLLLWMVASVLWSMNPAESLAILPTYAGLALLYFAIVLSPITVNEFKGILLLSIFSGLAAAVYGQYTFYHDPSITSASLIDQRLFINPNGPAIDPNQFANALLLPFAGILMLVLRATRLRVKFTLAACAVVIVLTIILSASREAALGVLLIFSYFFIRSRYRVQLAVFSLGILTLAFRMPSSLIERFSQGSERSDIWSVAWLAFKHQWLTGYGIGAFIDAYNDYYIRVAQTYSNGWDSPPHNIFVHYGVELGAVGLLLLAWFFYSQFRSLAAIKRDGPLYDYRVALEGALLSIAFVGMFIDLFNSKYAWLVFALVVQLRNANSTIGDADAEPLHDGPAAVEAPHESSPALAGGSLRLPA